MGHGLVITYFIPFHFLSEIRIDQRLRAVLNVQELMPVLLLFVYASDRRFRPRGTGESPHAFRLIGNSRNRAPTCVSGRVTKCKRKGRQASKPVAQAYKQFVFQNRLLEITALTAVGTQIETE